MAKDLTDLRLKSIAPTDSTKHFDGRTTGLFAQRLKADANISLKYRFQLNRKTRELHLGTYPQLTLAQAREKSRNYAEIVSSGKNPVLEKNGGNCCHRRSRHYLTSQKCGLKMTSVAETKSTEKEPCPD